MSIPNETVPHLKKQGITNVDDLDNFDKNTIGQIADNLQLPTGGITDPNPNSAAVTMITTDAFRRFL